ncbi:MAG: ABC transporter ATP-binding protein [Thermomicrobiales bacterium]|nr:ABC transporter ATP-binding protein [Thermomicrobiales bacterium]MCO5222189.1 ABC transporter ATP-binding protein [Thermomicrobiales bacterium]
MTEMHRPLLAIEHLSIGFPNERDGTMHPVVRDSSFVVNRNEVVGLVGESGSGKTQTAMSVLRLTKPPGQVLHGRILLDGDDILQMNDIQLRQVRGNRAAMIFQSPRTSLNPLMTIGNQVGRIYTRQRGMKKKDAGDATLEMLRRVGIAGPARVAASYPHQLSGGMAQRVMIAMMLACDPELLIADEPTTGLDVTIQAQIFELIQEIQQETHMALLLITHDLGVIAEVCQRVVVMQLGRIVEIAPVDTLFADPVHPYTRRLVGSILRPDLEVLPAAARGNDFPPVVLEVGGDRYQAVSVDSWRSVNVGRPEMVEVAPGHQVLAHAVDAPSEAVA